MSGSLMDDNRPQATAFVEQATGLPIQQYVLNGAVTAITPAEVASVISFGQRPLAMLIMSPAMAKSFATSLLARVKEYEDLTGSTVKSLSEIAASKITA